MAASSDHLASTIDPSFLLRHDFNWFNPSDNETLTKALDPFLLPQPDNYHYDNQSFSPFSSSDLEQHHHHHQQQQPTHPSPSTLSASASDPKSPATPKRRTTTVNGKSRITKRKSRATKKNQTTFITADPANFRQMVQQVTGIRFDTSPLPPLSQLLLKPETRRPVERLYNACLPTLDTSSFLLDHHRRHQQQTQQSQNLMVDQQSYGGGGLGLRSVEGGGSGGYGASSASDGFASFPTLESWKVM